jgi:hypothetical protein
MAVVVPIPIPSTEKTTYSLSLEGLHISKDSSTWWLYMFPLLAIWFGIGWSIPNANLWIVLLIAIFGSILIIQFVVLPLKQTQKYLHRRKIIPWDCMKSCELKGSNVKFKYNINGVYEEEISFTIQKEKVEDFTQFISNMLTNRFTVKN